MTTSGIIIHLSILLYSIKTSSTPDCLCHMNKIDFGNVQIPAFNDVMSVSPNDHVVDNINIGKLVSVDGIIMTQTNYHIKSYSNSLELEGYKHCPRGFRFPTKVDLEIINESLKGINFSKVTDSDKVNLPPNTFFFTADKVFPDDFSAQPSAFEFYGVTINSNDTSFSLDKVSSNKNNKPKLTKCVLDSYQSNKNRVNLEEDLMQNHVYHKDITMTNAVDYYVELTGAIEHSSKTQYSFKPTTPGCFYSKIKWKMWEGTIITKCEGVVVLPMFGSSHNTILDINTIEEKTFDLPELHREVKIHFRGASAPISANLEGGAYILHSIKENKKLQVTKVDQKMNKIKTMDLGLFGFPLDIASTESGFVVYVRDRDDPHKSVLVNFSENGDLRWSKTIMNNGDKPKEAKEQVMFHDEKGEPVIGMQAMYRPDNGKLRVGRHRIMLIFSHYNMFKKGENEYQGHTGDSTISFDMNGNDALLGSPWGTSHSLSQQIVYDGLQFLTSSLGDAHPQQVHFTAHNGRNQSIFVDGKTGKHNRYHTFSRSHVIPGSIPGDGEGRSCGRLGGLHIFKGAKFIKYAQVYSRHVCISGINNEKNVNDEDEIGIVFLDRELNKLGKFKLADGKNVNIIKSAGYGRNIAIMYSTSTKRDSRDPKFMPNTIADDDTCYMMLVRLDGHVLHRPKKLLKCIFGNDDPVTLKNGNAAWTSVDSSGKLLAYTLDDPIFEWIDIFNSGNDLTIGPADDTQPEASDDSSTKPKSAQLFRIGLRFLIWLSFYLLEI